MNDYDSGRMANLLQESHGLELVAEPDQADVILLNTCSVREKAEEKVYSELGRYRLLKANKPDLIIGVGGCVAQQERERIYRRAPYVDLVFGPQNYHQLPDMLSQTHRERVSPILSRLPQIEKFDHLPQPGARGVSACVTIMEGCNKFCTFCIVPYTRGREASRPAADVLAECRHLLEQGVKEITLLGQNVNAYKGPGPDGETWDLARLLREVARFGGLERLRFTTSHPLEMSDALMQAFADIPRLMPYLHLPVQSGSDRILGAMRRRHSRAEYLDIVGRLREHRPDIALSSDFIVGFPGETDADFSETVELVETVGFDSAYCFKYSPRPGTPAAKMEDDVPDRVKDERLQTLMALLNRQAEQALQRQVGRLVDVLVEKQGRRSGDMQGRTPDFKIVHFKGRPGLTGQILKVRLTRAYGQSLRGDLLLAQ